MKKAIKKTCVVLLLFALLASQVAASYSETGTLAVAWLKCTAIYVRTSQAIRQTYLSARCILVGFLSEPLH